MTGFTVTSKVIGVVAVPSLTFTVIVVVPLALATGVTVTVRLAPLPPSTTLALGTSVVLLLVAVTTSELAAVSRSPIVKLSAPVFRSSSIVWLAIAVTVGASSTAGMLVPRLTVALDQMPVAPRSAEMLRLVFSTRLPCELSASRTVSAPGVPL